MNIALSPSHSRHDPKRPPCHRFQFRSLIGIFLLALVLRAAWGTFQMIRAVDATALSLPDEQQYWLIAQSMHRGAGLQDELGFRATRMPLYPGILSLFAGFTNGIVAAKVLHWIVGAATAALVAGASGFMLGRRIGWVAGLVVAMDPFQIFTSSLLLTETPFIAALVGLWWSAWPMIGAENPNVTYKRWLVIGVVSALVIYLRVSSVGLVLLLLAYVVTCRRFNRGVVLGSVLAIIMVAFSLFPWAIRNHRVTGEWCWLTHRGGISLYDGVGPQADGSSNLGEIKQMSSVKGLNEVEWNRYFFRASIESIRSDPERIFRLAGVKMRRMWNPFPNVDSHQSRFERFVAAGWMLPLYMSVVAGAVWWVKRDGASGVRHVLYLLLPAIYLSLLHSLFVGSVRYRLGATPMLEILAAWFVVTAYEHFQISKRGGHESVAQQS